MIRFQAFGVPVHIDPWFFLTALLVRPESTTKHAWLEFFLWVPIVCFGVLLHEGGHAWMGVLFGEHPMVRLSWMGGLTSWESRKRFTPGRNILVSLAGPSTGITIGLLVVGMGLAMRPTDGTITRYVIDSLVWVNLGWSFLNLVPILPLDGGHALLGVLEWLSPVRGRMVMHGLSFVGSVMGAFALVLHGVIFLGFLLALFAWTNWNGFSEKRSLSIEPPAKSGA